MNMKRPLAALLVLGIASVGLAAPAAAYDRDAYAYGAGHMIGHGDIPKALDMKKGASFSAYPSSGSNDLCFKEDSSKGVKYPGGEMQYSMGYEGRNRSGMSSTVSQYASAKKAINAFDTLKENLKQCDGTSSDSQTFDDGSTDSWERLTTSGSVPLVTVAGVESVFQNENYNDVSTGQYGGRYTSDTYTVYTLLNDVIITTNYYSGSELNLTKKQRRAVNQVAFNAVTRWLD